MKVAILGFGREGKSILKFFERNSRFKKSEIWILDKNSNLRVPREIKKVSGKNYLKNLRSFDLIFRSPGIPYNLPGLKKARRAGVKFSSLTKLFFEHCPGTIVGVTGTKGKGTTATLIFKILKAAHRDAYLVGNIGKAALEILPRLKKWSLVVFELSSFQLQGLETSPKIAVVLDIFPDHLEGVKTAEHGTHLSLDEYISSKANIVRFQNKKDKVVFLKNNGLAGKIAGHGSGKKIGVGENNFLLFRAADLKIKGMHNFRNAIIAATVARELGVAEKTIAKVVKEFRGTEHRLEFVRRIDVVEFYNDSASTNPQTTAAAVASFPGQEKILIAGGHDKNLDYAPLARAIKNSGTKFIILFGQNKNKIARAVKNSGLPIKLVANLKMAIDAAYKFAKELAAANRLPVVIIFSPGAASFDMFRDYADRGKQFKDIVKNLTKTKK